MNVIDHVFFALNYAQIRYLEWAGHIIYGRAPAGTGELATAQGVQLFFAGILGIVFAYLVLLTSDRNHLFKGWVYSIFVWFILFSIACTSRLPMLKPANLPTAWSNIISASVYGLFLAATLHWIEKRFGGRFEEA